MVSGFVAVGADAEGDFAKLETGTLTYNVPGYLFIYVVNESNQNADVFFDDLKITHSSSTADFKVSQVNEYYPYGLHTDKSWRHEGYVDPGMMYQAAYAGYDSLTGYYDFLYRSYDPALGQFFAVDPMAGTQTAYSPYHANYNNPVMYVDPLGLAPDYWPRHDSNPSSGGGGDGPDPGNWISSGLGSSFGRIGGISPISGNYWTNDLADMRGDYGYNYAYMSTNGFDARYGFDRTSDTYAEDKAEFLAMNTNFGEHYVIGDVSYKYYDENQLDDESKGDAYLGVSVRRPDIIVDFQVVDNRTGLQKANDIAYEINKWNPLAIAINSVHAYFTGVDWERGNPMSASDATINLASILPIGKVLKVGKFVVQPNALSHIFRNAAGHVNPQTATSQMRYLNLFSDVANNPANLVKTTNAAAAQAGVQTFKKTYRNGEVWVQVRGGKIFNAGVNKLD